MTRPGANIRKFFPRGVRVGTALPVGMLLAAALLLAGCGTDDIASLPEAAGGSVCPGEGVSRITVNGQAFVSEYVGGKGHACDPLAVAGFDPTVPVTYLAGAKHWVSGFGLYDDIVQVMTIGPVPTSFPAAYTMVSGPINPGEAGMFMALDQSGTSGTPTFCDNTTGGATISAYGPLGGYVKGSYNATLTGDYGCPASASGSFEIVRVSINFSPP
jgi:hypothetical protein